MSDEAYCQPCVSPVWDTALVCHALLEVGGERAAAAGQRGLEWLTPLQVLDVRGDWSRGGPMCGRAAGRSSTPIRIIPTSTTPPSWSWRWTACRACPAPRTSIRDRAGPEWIVGMQSANGGWGAFDADNDYYYLNNIPFADHGALLDPPTEDVTARCLSMLAQLRRDATDSAAVKRALDYLRRTQLADGSWYGRWGMNYIYGTWSVLCALNAAGVDHADARRCARRCDWLIAIQNADGGWGEDGASYKLDYRGYERAPSHRLADRLGAARPDGGRRGRSSGGGARHRLSRRARKAPTASGTSRATPRPVSRACSTCATTAIRNSSRSGRWRATAI